MTITSKTKTIEFGAQDEDFIKRLAEDIGCHYHQANERTYNLNNFCLDTHSELGAFAWVHKEDAESFWITTRKIWVEKSRTKAVLGKKASDITCLPRDIQHAADSVRFETKDDYQKTVSALKLIKESALA